MRFLLLCLFGILSGCYFDNEEDLYPSSPGGCNTTAVSYNNDIVPIMNSRCVSCHSGGFPSGGLALNTHALVSGNINNIIDRIKRNLDDALLMPQGAKLDPCSIEKIEAWARQGALNN